MTTATGTNGDGTTGPTGGSSGSSASPVSAAAKTRIRRRFPGKAPNYRRSLVGAGDIGALASMKAEGISNQRIAKALAISPNAVVNSLKLPETQAEIAKRRELLKGLSIHRFHDLAPRAWDLAEAAIQARDAKSLDATLRALHAGEKISASVSGENQRFEVQHTGAVDTQPVTVQLQQLIAMVKGEST